MVKGQRLIAADGYEYALYPMESIRITQSYAGSYSHSSWTQENTGLWDVTGVTGDNPKGEIYAPFSGTIIYIGDGHQTFLMSSDKVHYADGTLDYAMFSFGHDNKSDVKVGQFVTQGQKIGDAGDYGKVTGVHSHFLLYKGKWPFGKKIPVCKNKNGNHIYYAKGSPADIDKLFRIDGIRAISTYKIDGLTLNWREHGGEAMDLSKYLKERDEYKHQIKITANNVCVRKTPNGEKYSGIHLPEGIYDYGATSTAGAYTWMQLDDDIWFALSDQWCEDLPATKVKPDTSKYIVERDTTKHQINVTGDVVRVRESANGTIYQGVYVTPGIYNYGETAEAAGSTWMKLANDIWFSISGDWCEDLPAEEPTDYKALYEEEVKKYNALELDYKQLGTENAALSAQLKNLQDNYDAMEIDYTKIKGELSSANSKITKAKEALA